VNGILSSWPSWFFAIGYLDPFFGSSRNKSNSNYQIPITKQIPMNKYKIKTQTRTNDLINYFWNLEFGFWSLFGYWNLVIGYCLVIGAW